jgi:hypothetical protein
MKDPERSYGLCAEPGSEACFAAMDGGADATDTSDAMDGGDGPFPPEMLCHRGNCLPLPQAIRSQLVLLLWPSNLPPVGSTVSVWADQSGQGNDATALYPSALPQVIRDGVHLDPNQLGGGFHVANKPSLDFGSGDFAIVVVAGLSSSATPVGFFRKSDGARMDSRQISLDWVRTTSSDGEPQGAVNGAIVVPNAGIPQFQQPSVGAYTLQRSTDHIELHLDGTVLGSNDVPAGASTTNASDVFVGVQSAVGSPADSIEAVLAIRGSVGSSDLNQLESFLRTLFVLGAP